jgi:hypothetical protein
MVRIPYLPETAARGLADALYRSAKDFTLIRPSAAGFV